ncbi:hypothetical protein BDV26DRAFT_175287 [Aspergillus bertholletiae]|uniref:Uncharacterized protein n=1 Tax=Aspergillus bertholletiae TaxID=1226010 RepID=A0A5N7BBK8_9EURO|nr:hypothetical protein BDV26DRAFT_175287 [Aspergillus bertholletiae]
MRNSEESSPKPSNPLFHLFFDGEMGSRYCPQGPGVNQDCLLTSVGRWSHICNRHQKHRGSGIVRGFLMGESLRRLCVRAMPRATL